MSAMFFAGAFFLQAHFFHAPVVSSPSSSLQKSAQGDNPAVVKDNLVISDTKARPDFVAPLLSASLRVTKKPFGIFITPQNSPVSPEKFRGYHTGSDFEIFPSELNQAVSVKAICDGTLALKEYATGYGGVAVENCTLDGAPITVIYGHLKLASINISAGEKITAGDTLGILGADKSTETDGERKHLHLGIHKGVGVNILGYVQNSPALSGWIDPCLYVCQK